MLNRRSRRLFWWIPALFLIVSCSDDDGPKPPTEGTLLVRFLLDPAGRDRADWTARPDSVLLDLRDPEGGIVSSLAEALPDTGQVSFTFTLGAAEDLTVMAQLIGAGPMGDRGTILADRRPGIDVENGKTTGVVLDLAEAVSGAPTIAGGPGETSYRVSWTAVSHATSYRLYERVGGVAEEYGTSDTSRVFDLAFESGSAGLLRQGVTAPAAGPAADRRCYFVAARLPLGDGALSDSTCFLPDVWLDLPRVTAVIPEEGASGVPKDAEIEVRFDRPMDPASFADTLVTLRPAGSGREPALTLVWGDEGRQLRLEPDSSLTRGSSYTLRISAKVKGSDGRPLDQDPASAGLQAFSSSFRVEDYDPLRVSLVVPEPMAESVSVAVRPRILFDRPVRFETVTTSTFHLTGPAGNLAGRVAQVDAEAQLFEFRPDADLPYGDLVHVHVETGVLDAQRGEPLDQDAEAPGFQPFEEVFRTEEQPLGPRVAGSHPADGEPNIAVYDSLIVIFDRAVTPSSVEPERSLRIQFRSGEQWINIRVASDTQDGIRFVFRPIDDLPASLYHRIVVKSGPEGVRGQDGAPFDQDPAQAGFQDFTATFQTETTIDFESVYPLGNDVAWDDSVVVRFDAPIDPATVTESSLSLRSAAGPVPAARHVTADHRSAVLRPRDLLRDLTTYEVTVASSIASEDGGRFDHIPSEKGHQGYRYSFRTAKERIPPRVTASVPGDSSSGVPVETTIQVVFSEPVLPGSVPDNFSVRRGSVNGALVLADVSVASDSMSALLWPRTPLEHDTDYHVRVSHQLQDRHQNYLDQDPDTPEIEEFQSVFATVPERIRPWVTSMVPDKVTGVALDAVITLDFSEQMDPARTEAAVSIRGDGVPLGATIAFPTPSRAVITPSGLAYDMFVEVQVDSLAQDLNGNGLDQQPLTERHEIFNSYFTTLADTFGPRVLGVTPADGAEDVDPAVVVVVEFDEALDADAALDSAAVWLEGAGGARVPVARSLDAARRSVSLQPATPLPYDTVHRIFVGTALTDSVGNPFDADPGQPGNQSRMFSFTTMEDVNAPRVLDGLTFDAGDSSEVPITSRIHVLFNEPIDSTTVDSMSVLLVRAGDRVGASLDLDAEGTGLTIDPQDYLEYDAGYVVRIEGVVDLQGNPLDQDPATGGDQAFEGTFTTEAPPPGSPRVESWTPIDGSLNIPGDYRARLTFDRLMDAETILAPGAVVVTRNGDTLEVEIAIEGDRIVTVFQANGWDRGVHALSVAATIQDLAGRALDQDPGTPGDQGLVIGFEVGRRPVIDAGAMVCSDASSLDVPFTAAVTTFDAPIVAWTWTWGDGTETEYAPPQGESVNHLYPCDAVKILAGCHAGDPCDRSYAVSVAATDEDGLTGRDATGVSFCAFVATSVDSAEAVTDSVRIGLSRACDPATVTADAVWLETEDGTPVDAVLSVEEEETIVIAPAASLQADTVYRVRADADLHDPSGAPLDQEPCTGGSQELSIEFRTAAP